MTGRPNSALNGQPTIAELVGNVITGAEELARAHGSQVQAEIRTHVLRARNATILLIAGVAVALMGVIFLLVAVAVLLRDQLGWPGWVAWLVVGLGTVGIGVAVHLAGHNTWRRVHFIPTRSLQSMRESLSWITRTPN